jgi:hypothetical protein
VFEVLAVLPGARHTLDQAMTAALINRLVWDLLSDPHALTEATVASTVSAFTEILYHLLFVG